MGLSEIQKGGKPISVLEIFFQYFLLAFHPVNGMLSPY